MPTKTLSRRSTAVLSSSCMHANHHNHFYQNRILQQYAHAQPSLITLRQLVVFGRQLSPSKLLVGANHVRSELPIRLAHRIRDFQQLPYLVVTNPHITAAYDIYWRAFDTIRRVKEIKSLEENAAFCQALHGLLDDNRGVIPQLVTGIRQSRDAISPEEADRFIMECLRSRVSRRVLAEQHLALTQQLKQDQVQGTRIGVVDTQCEIAQLLPRCIQAARDDVAREFHIPPDELPGIVVNGRPDAQLMGISAHVEYMLTEILGNALRFTYLRRQRCNDDHAVIVTVAEGESDLVFRISDRAGGIPEYVKDPTQVVMGISSTSSALPSSHPCDSMMVDRQSAKPIAPHLGIGLLMARVYAEYWGGDIAWKGLNGWGTDVYIRLGSRGTRYESVSGISQIE